MESEKQEVLYKILVVGDIGSGKTSILRRYTQGHFSQYYKSTIGVDFAPKIIHEENRVVRLQFWDIAGQERYGNMTRVYYQQSVGAFVVFDVTRESTFHAVAKWKSDIDSKLQAPFPVILLANKVDLITQEQDECFWTTQKGKMNDFCDLHGFVTWFEVSAKEDVGIKEAFPRIVVEIDKIQNDPERRREESEKAILRLRLKEQEEGMEEGKRCC